MGEGIVVPTKVAVDRATRNPEAFGQLGNCVDVFARKILRPTIFAYGLKLNRQVAAGLGEDPYGFRLEGQPHGGV